MHEDVMSRVDVGVQTISDWYTESIPSIVDVIIQTEGHCVYRCDDSHMVHHFSNTVTNAYDNCLEEYQRSDEEHLLLMDMEIDDNQAGSCTQDDAICLDHP